MGYSFTIGKAAVSISEDDEDFYLLADTVPVSDDAPGFYADKSSDDSCRTVSYSVWHNACQESKPLAAIRERINHHYKEHGQPWIPIKVYSDLLDALEHDPVKDDAEGYGKERHMWLVAWSRKALELYGDLAAFETPGEF